MTPRQRGARLSPGVALVLLLGVGAGLAWWLWPEPSPPAVAMPAPEAPAPAAKRPSRPMPPPEIPVELPSVDPDDLAVHFRPGDPEPTGAELITALQEAGIHTGLGAFNPPGTSPPLEGLAVPEDYELPEGYLRHHQFHDDGRPIEAILMFAPGAEFRDAQGNLVALPANGVVPPELAPKDLPLRWVRPDQP
ncbi:hypothetical protein C6N40_06670 [Arenimonas caeni]|uniref:Uncharacterized protein n=1 Tax=Arenimonas caeni TaxID=2058085 RepID=A0A2P6M9D0_9GAMM|nr:hypothetical protein C6N40_06670 [Arenimonas caeni]